MIPDKYQPGLLFHNIQVICADWMREENSECAIISFNGQELEEQDTIAIGIHKLFRGEKLHEAVSCTVQLFQQVQERWLLPFITTYHNYLIMLKEGHTSKEQVVEDARIVIQNWRAETSAFLEYLGRDPRPQRIQEFLQHYFKGENPFITHYEPLVDRYHAICRLEVASRCALPLHDWHLMAKYNRKITSGTDHAKWVKKFQRHRAKTADPLTLSRGLQSITEFFRTIDPSVEFNLGQIAYRLWENSEEFLQEPDPHHIAWRQSIQAGTEIAGMRVTDCVRESPGSDDKWIYYFDDPHCMAKVLQNPLLTLAHAYSLTIHELPIPMVQIQAVDPDGRYILMERLNTSTGGIAWKQLKVLADDQRQRLDVVVKIMSYFIDNKWCPDIPLSHFNLTTEGELRTMRPFVKTAFWLDPLQDLALETAEGNPIVFTYLMKGINLHQMTVYPLYQDIVSEFANGEEEYLTSGTSRVHLQSHQFEWKERMQALRAVIQEIRKAALALPNTSEAAVSAAIMSYYNETYCLSSLLPHAKEAILEKLNNSTVAT